MIEVMMCVFSLPPGLISGQLGLPDKPDQIYQRKVPPPTGHRRQW